MDYLPLFYKLRRRRCLVLGEATAADTRARQLAAAGADVVRCSRWPPAAGEEALADCALAIGASARADDNRRLSQAAQERGVPVNVVDSPALSTVIFPAVIDRGRVVAAVGTGGLSPTLARHLKIRVERAIPHTAGALAELVDSQRAALRERLADPLARQRFWQDVLDGPIGERALAGDVERAAEMLAEAIAKGTPETGVGEAYLVGAGPGDPELLTLAALRLMQRADVVLYDRLLNPAMLDFVRQEAARIDVGKRAGAASMPQEEINRLLVEHAQSGQRVLRLKGGDALIFARGGEEMDALAAGGVPFRLVPGITAATACACCAGIPLTHREHASAVRFLTGHRRGDSVPLPWPDLCRADETLVFYMSFSGLEIICGELVRAGRDAATPVALVSRGSLPDQRVWISTLAGLARRIADEVVAMPTVLIVGAVAALGRER